jgi:putative restriction endonuclease
VAKQFITIGSKGASIPTHLTEIPPLLVVGANNQHWANHGSIKRWREAREAHGWVSENGEPFEIYPIEQAIAERRVQRIEGAAWTVQGRRYTGTAYLPASWRMVNKIPQYVAVTGAGWPHGRVETKRLKNNREFFGTVELPVPVPSIRPRKDWTRDELLILLNVYDKIPFGQFDQDQPVIKSIADQMERSPGSVAMKLGNLASLDPATHARGRKGLSGASDLDRMTFTEFSANRGELAPRSEELFRKLFKAKPDDELELIKNQGVRVRKSLNPPIGATESSAQRKIRRGQQYFRQVVLNAYDAKCCITGIQVPELLVASHIKPWNACNDEERLTARNGLCLSKLHDAAFDAFLITLDKKLRVQLSRRLLMYFPSPALEKAFAPYENRAIILPAKLSEPDEGFLAYHRAKFHSKIS